MKTLIVLCALGLLAACEDKPPPRTAFDPQGQVLEKARAVEATVREAGEKRAEEEVQQIQGY